jgi:Flavin containing amine oxidoreductase
VLLSCSYPPVDAYFAWDWQNDPYTRGAFALFDPGQFYEMFPAISRPAGGGYLHFAGEAMSVHHAWISGAIASAYRSVLEILIMEGQTPAEAESALANALGGLLRQPEEIDMELLGQQVAYGAFPGLHMGMEEIEQLVKKTKL